MTRDEALQGYRPLRSAIQDVLKVITDGDFFDHTQDALIEVAPWAENDEITEEMLNMATDVALFEPDEDGQRRIDLFVAINEASLPPDRLDLVQKMQGAWFSLFRVEGRHEIAGLWFEDLLDGDRRIWIMDEAMERTAVPNDIVAMRLFEAGPFHTGFGIVVECNDDILGQCLAAQARRIPIPVLSTLAALVYSDKLLDDELPDDDELDAEATADLMDEMSALLRSTAAPVIEHRVALNKPKSKRSGRRKSPKHKGR